MARKLAVLVTGATGKQGGAVARQLAQRGHRVRALTRNVASPALRRSAPRASNWRKATWKTAAPSAAP